MKKFIIVFLIVVNILLCACDNLILTIENDTTDNVQDLPSNNYMLCDEYNKLLEDYVSIVNYRLSETFEIDNINGILPSISKDLYDQVYSNDKSELNEKWFCMIADMTDNIQTKNVEAFGYILKDLDKDNIEEILWVDSSYTILAIFTVKDGNVVLLDAFWSKYKCVLSAEGFVYTCAIGGAKCGVYELKYLRSDDKTLDVYKTVSIESVSVDGRCVDEYYEIVNGNKISITEMEYNVFFKRFPFKHTIDWSNEPILPLID